MAKASKQPIKTSHRLWWLVQLATGLVLGYALLLRALDTGSLLYYFLVLVLVVLIVKRVAWLFKGKLQKDTEHGRPHQN